VKGNGIDEILLHCFHQGSSRRDAYPDIYRDYSKIALVTITNRKDIDRELKSILKETGYGSNIDSYVEVTKEGFNQFQSWQRTITSLSRGLLLLSGKYEIKQT
jgi:hypothetical protein